MSIWVYCDTSADEEAVKATVNQSDCIFCRTKLTVLSEEHDTLDSGPGNTGIWAIDLARCCPTCGWWTAERRVETNFGGTLKTSAYGAVGILKKLDLRDQSLPLDEIRAYLIARYDARFSIDPWRFEEVVASVYRDHGYRARVTARSRDGGVDIILDGPDSSVIGVQVKRHRGKVKVGHIRDLTGALVDPRLKLTSGVCVTTSEFQPGAQEFAAIQRLQGRRIDLVDAAAFYDALGLAQRKQYDSFADNSAPFRVERLIPTYSHEFKHGVP